MEFMSLIPNATGLIAGLGIGTAFTSYFQYRLNQREHSISSQRVDLEKRYRVIILLMYAAYDFRINATSLRINRPDLENQEQVLDELKAEWFNMLLFASISTQNALQEFVLAPTANNLMKTADCMRTDLGRGSFYNSIKDFKF